MGDRELDALEGRYRRGLGGIQPGHPIPLSLQDMGALITEVKDLRRQINRLVEQLEEQDN